MKRVYFLISLLLVIGWMVVIFYLSEMPSDESNGNSKKIVNKIIEETMETSANENAETRVDNSISTTTQKNEKDNLESFNFIFRKLAHTGVYFVLSIFVLNLFLQIKNQLNIKLVLLGVIAYFIFACTDELHQLFVDGRNGQLMDVAIDTVGAVSGALIFYMIYNAIKSRTKT